MRVAVTADAPGSMSGVTVDVQYASAAESAPPEDEVARWVAAALCEAGETGPVEVCVRIVDEEEGRHLNSAFRSKDGATNVLSFPGIAAEAPRDVPELARSLGDIVICAPIVEREALEQGKALADHWGHLLVHGTLHLLGFEHEAEPEAEHMEALERRVLERGGVADPYKD